MTGTWDDTSWAMGRFVSLEGTEGSGKTTAAATLADALESGGCEVVRTREPGGTPVGEDVRAAFKSNHGLSAEEELFLMLASRASLVRNVIRPALERGACVVCDRHADSSYVYQSFLGGMPLDTVRAMNAVSTGGLEPDATIVVLTDYATARGRMDARDTGLVTDKYDGLDEAGFLRIRDGYLSVRDLEPARVSVVSGEGSPTDTALAVMFAMAESLGA